MAKSIWNGSLSFGLVDVPVRLVPAVREKDVKFRWLHAKDGARVEIRRVCSADGEEVPWDEIVKGFPVSEDEYVALTREEVAEAGAPRREDIAVLDFVDQGELDAIYLERPYYLVPEREAARAYRVLHEAMREMGRVAIARMTLRGKEQLVAVRPLGEMLVLTTLLYHDELVDPSGLEAPAPGRVDTRELALAERIVDALTTRFEPERYADETRERVLDLIEHKRTGRRPRPAPAREAAPPELIDALTASLEALRRGRPPGEEARA